MADAYILITAAVEGELAGLEAMLSSPEEACIGRRRIVSGRLENRPVRLLTAGPGVINTAQALTSAIENDRPSLIIQTGCAGAFRPSGIRIGDIAVAVEIIDIHSGIEAEKEGEGLDPLPFPLMTLKGRKIRGRYLLDHSLAQHAYDILNPRFSRQGINVAKGRFAAVSTITATDMRAEKLYRCFHPCMEEMEGAGAAHVALHYDIPLVAVRAASNIVGKRKRAEWNLPLAFERAGEAVRACCKALKHFSPGKTSSG